MGPKHGHVGPWLRKAMPSIFAFASLPAALVAHQLLCAALGIQRRVCDMAPELRELPLQQEREPSGRQNEGCAKEGWAE